VRGALLPIVLLLLAGAARAGDGEAGKEAPKFPRPVPRPTGAPPAEKPPTAEAKTRPPAKDLAAAKAEAGKSGMRILAVITTTHYESEPCRALEEALGSAEARAVLDGFVVLLAKEGEDLAFSKSLGLEGLGHPCTALLDAEGKPQAWLRGAWDGASWAREVKRLLAAVEALAGKRAAAEKAPGDPGALWEWSEALRAAGRTGEADDALARAENADPEGKSGLAAQFAFRRLEARVEDRMAIQDFEGARDLLDAHDREHPLSPRRAWVALYRALARAGRGEVDDAVRDLEDLLPAAKEKDPDLHALAESRLAGLKRIADLRSSDGRK
jgi:hypothetical protein